MPVFDSTLTSFYMQDELGFRLVNPKTIDKCYRNILEQSRSGL